MNVDFRLLVIFFINFLTLSLSVDRSNFKTCNDSGFCKRQRNFRPSSSVYEVVPDSIETFKTKVNARLKNTQNNREFTLELTKVVGRTFRVKVNEVNPLKPRYEIPIGDTLVAEPSQGEVTVSKESDGSYILKGTQGEKAVLHLKPFRLDFFLNDRPLVSANAQGRMLFEHYRTKPADAAEGSTEEEKKEEDSTDKPADEATPEEKKPEPTPSTPQGDENLEGAWDESFKGHADSKPHGPSSVGVDFTFPDFEHVYGLPEHGDSLALKNTDSGDPYRLYNLDVFEYELNNPMALYGSVPLLWAHNPNNTAGVFWHNPSETWVDIKSSRGSQGAFSKLLSLVKSSEEMPEVHTHWFSESGIIDAFIFLGDNPSEVVYQYGKLTGTTPLPPLFSVAYHQCRWNYNDQEDVLGVDANFDKYDIPYDVIWLDIEHTDGKKYFTWDTSKFPDPVAMVDKLDGKRRKLVTVIDPHIKRDDGWDLFREARDKGLFIKQSHGSGDYDGWCWPGSSSWLDFTSADVRRWWAERYLTYLGSRSDNTFTWNDMGEPSIFNGPEITMRKDAVHAGGWEHRDVHNLYGLLVHRASWEGQELRSQNNERPFVLTRAFFAGSQRYGAVWTGDNMASWSHLKASIPMVLSMSVTGITFSGADVGGFFGNPEDELLVRWYQAGAYQPFFRAHAHLDTKRREPWLLSQENMMVIRESIRARYALLPYWYTLFYRSETSNEPVMAPLWFYFPKDTATFALDDVHMVGDALLVKPVTDQGASSISVYLPQGPDTADKGVWYLKDSWKAYSGGETVTVPVDLKTIPVFYRGGFIIPRKERIRRSSNLGRYDPYTLVVALNRAGRADGYLYIDDYHTMRYQKNNELAYFKMEFNQGELRMRKVDMAGNYRVKSRVERVVILGVTHRPNKVVLDTEMAQPQPLESFYSTDTKILVIRNPNVVVGDDWVIRVQMSDKVEL